MTLNFPAGKTFLTSEEMADLLRVSQSGLRNIRKRGEIGFIRVGKRVVIYPVEEAARYIEQHLTDRTAPEAAHA
jgi:excisionase family DNA binding protein